MIAGVDEAGRGCVIGPMVICIASVGGLDEFKLKELGVKDSKKLSAKRREELFPEIEKLCRLTVIKIPASEINYLMDRHTLNEIEAMKIGEGLNITDPLPSIVYIDSPDNIPVNFGKRIEKYLKRKVKLVCENKADDKHLIVGAASIVAKVLRDREIERIKRVVKYDFNSGYTSDPFTIEYLAKHANDEKLAPFLRTKWKTLANIKQRKLGEF